MARIRTFVAIDLNDSVRRKVRELLSHLREAVPGVRWVDANQAHVTLKFLGEMEENKVYEVCQVIQRIAADHAPFTMECRGLGAFPSANRPRTLWLGLIDDQSLLTSVHQSVEDSLRVLGFPQEHRAFRAHVTLGRIQDGGRTHDELPDALERYAEFDGGLLSVDQLTLYASQLSRSGPSYTVLSRSTLAK